MKLKASRRQPARRIAGLVVGTMVAALIAVPAAWASTPFTDIHSAGPLSDIYIGNDLELPGARRRILQHGVLSERGRARRLWNVPVHQRLDTQRRSSSGPTSQITPAARTRRATSSHRGDARAPRSAIADRIGHRGESYKVTTVVTATIRSERDITDRLPDHRGRHLRRRQRLLPDRRHGHEHRRRRQLASRRRSTTPPIASCGEPTTGFGIAEPTARPLQTGRPARPTCSGDPRSAPSSSADHHRRQLGAESSVLRGLGRSQRWHLSGQHMHRVAEARPWTTATGIEWPVPALAAGSSADVSSKP